jgi:hypothetical protein
MQIIWTVKTTNKADVKVLSLDYACDERHLLSFALQHMDPVDPDKLRAKITRNFIEKARVFCCTLCSSLGPQMFGISFDLVVVDEAGQVIIFLCIIYIIKLI